ncbi:hypothetical protein ES703_118083 [subsurface metagenome]
MPEIKISEPVFCLELKVGAITHCPFSSRPIERPATGPCQGISEIETATEAPIKAGKAGSFSPSKERTVKTI